MIRCLVVHNPVQIQTQIFIRQFLHIFSFFYFFFRTKDLFTFLWPHFRTMSLCLRFRFTMYIINYSLHIRVVSNEKRKEDRHHPYGKLLGILIEYFFIVPWPAHDIRSQIQSVLIIYWYLQTNDDELNRAHYVSSSCAK